MKSKLFYCPNNVNKNASHHPLINFGSKYIYELNGKKFEVDEYYCRTCKKSFISTEKLEYINISADIENVERFEVFEGEVPEVEELKKNEPIKSESCSYVYRRNINYSNVNEYRDNIIKNREDVEIKLRKNWNIKDITNEDIEEYKNKIESSILEERIGDFISNWKLLIEFIPYDLDLLIKYRNEISKKGMSYRDQLYTWKLLYSLYKKKKKWDIAIEILKQNLSVEPKDTWARKEIVDCYKGKYEGHSHLEDYIRSSNLTANYRNVFEAINDFEKHIAFDKGSFVFHRNWGVGIIRKLADDTLTINFGKATGIKEMKLSMAVTALKPLAKDHIWVLKATKNKVELADQIKKDKVWALKTIIKSYDNECDFKHIQAELVLAILTPGEWTSWTSAAKKILENDIRFYEKDNKYHLTWPLEDC